MSTRLTVAVSVLYGGHNVAVCLTVNGITRLRLPPPIIFIRDITAVDRKPSQNPAV